MGNTLAVDKQLQWATEDDIEEMPSALQTLVLCPFGETKTESVIQAILDQNVLTKESQAQVKDASSFKVAELKSICYEENFVAMTSVILSGNCQSWANVQDSLSDKGDNAYALVLFAV